MLTGAVTVHRTWTGEAGEGFRAATSGLLQGLGTVVVQSADMVHVLVQGPFDVGRMPEGMRTANRQALAPPGESTTPGVQGEIGVPGVQSSGTSGTQSVVPTKGGSTAMASTRMATVSRSLIRAHCSRVVGLTCPQPLMYPLSSVGPPTTTTVSVAPRAPPPP
jgi:hypothetical protein